MANKLTLTDGEAILIGGDFSTQLASGDLVVSSNSYGSTLVAVKDADGVDVTTTLVQALSLQIVDTIVYARVQATAPNEMYYLSFWAATSNGDYLELKIVLKSKD